MDDYFTKRSYDVNCFSCSYYTLIMERNLPTVADGGRIQGRGITEGGGGIVEEKPCVRDSFMGSK